MRRCVLGCMPLLPVIGMPAAAFVDNPSMENPIATGKITAKLSATTFAVTMENVSAVSPVIEVGSRVVVSAENSSAGGLVAKVHPNGTFSILRDDDAFLQNVSRTQLSVVEPSTAIASTDYAGVVNWIRDAGVARKADAQSAATILFRRGWRQPKLYLLESADVHCLHHLNKSVRMGILESADAERDKARYERDLRKEQLKEEDWRYFVFKYSSVVGALTASFGAISVFTWNWKNWKKAQRPAQVASAAATWCEPQRYQTVRKRDEARMGRILGDLDIRHPRLLIIASVENAGKALLQATCTTLRIPLVTVELRGNERADPIRSLVKALGASNLDVCGDLFTFVEEVAGIVATRTGKVPVVLLKFNEGTPGHVYDDAVTLACERRVCHVLIDASHEEARRALLRLPRTEIFQVNDLSSDEAKSYVGKRVDPLILEEALESVGTNTGDLDELVAACRLGPWSCESFVANKLQHCLVQVKSQPPEVLEALKAVSAVPYEIGLSSAVAGLEDAIQKELLYYHADKDAWVFRSKAMHEAAQIA